MPPPDAELFPLMVAVVDRERAVVYDGAAAVRRRCFQ